MSEFYTLEKHHLYDGGIQSEKEIESTLAREDSVIEMFERSMQSLINALEDDELEICKNNADILSEALYDYLNGNTDNIIVRFRKGLPDKDGTYTFINGFTRNLSTLGYTTQYGLNTSEQGHDYPIDSKYYVAYLPDIELKHELERNGLEINEL